MATKHKNALVELSTSRLPADPLEDAIREMAQPSTPSPKVRDAPSALGWFTNIRPDGNEAQNIAARALLLVADTMADAKRRVPIADLMLAFPRSALSPCIQILRSQNFASSDGRALTIAKTPVDEQRQGEPFCG